jgi:hypothetical protein
VVGVLGVVVALLLGAERSGSGSPVQAAVASSNPSARTTARTSEYVGGTAEQITGLSFRRGPDWVIA